MSAGVRKAPLSDLIGTLVMDQADAVRRSGDDLIAFQQAQIDEAAAELWAIREGVSKLLAGLYMPTPEVIRQAVFYPAQELIDEYKANKEVGR